MKACFYLDITTTKEISVLLLTWDLNYKCISGNSIIICRFLKMYLFSFWMQKKTCQVQRKRKNVTLQIWFFFLSPTFFKKCFRAKTSKLFWPNKIWNSRRLTHISSPINIRVKTASLNHSLYYQSSNIIIHQTPFYMKYKS